MPVVLSPLAFYFLLHLFDLTEFLVPIYFMDVLLTYL